MIFVEVFRATARKLPSAVPARARQDFLSSPRQSGARKIRTGKNHISFFMPIF
jgi:hypothetical protein